MPSRDFSRLGRVLRILATLAIVAATAVGVAAMIERAQRPEPTSPSWVKAQTPLADADSRSERAAEARLETLCAFFNEKSRGTRAFAEEALSFSGKWELFKGAVGAGDHAGFLADSFRRHVFTAADLRSALEQTVTGYLADLDGLENDLLVKLRADLAEGDLGRGAALPCLQSDVTFLRAYRRVEAGIKPRLERELGITIAREVGSMVAAQIATNMAMRVVYAAAAELGVSAGILSSGAVSAGTTIGIGLVVALVVDAVINDVMRACGHDPERELTDEVRSPLDRVQELLIDGTPGAVATHARLCRMATEDRFYSVRAACRNAVDRIERGGQMGLRWEMRRLHEVRARMRREALRKLLVEGEEP